MRVTNRKKYSKKAGRSKSTRKSKRVSKSKHVKKVKSSRKKRSSIKRTKKRIVRRKRRGAGGDDDEDNPYPVYSQEDIDKMSVKELLSKLNPQSKSMEDFKKTYAKEDADTQKWILGLMLGEQNKSNAEFANYFSKEETEKNMVYEKGRLPHDKRITEDTQVDAPRKGPQVIEKKDPIAMWDPNSKYPTVRAKAAFQKEWFKENPLDINHALMDIERTRARYKSPGESMISVSFVHNQHEKYYEAFHKFLKTEEFEKAQEEQTKAFDDLATEQRKERGERTGMDKEDDLFTNPDIRQVRQKRKDREAQEARDKRRAEERARQAKIKQDRKEGKFDPKKVYYSDALYNGYFIGTSTSKYPGKKYVILPSTKELGSSKSKSLFVVQDVAARPEHEVKKLNMDTIIPDIEQPYISFEYSDAELDKKFNPLPPPPPQSTSYKDKRKDDLRERMRARQRAKAQESQPSQKSQGYEKEGGP